ncbi:MAG TPA: metal-sensitive transcriptional regulator [Candidatus Ozemobacteraceae bacterium]|nr:metal-sensitive transcriptional regulator [Candidatus Ozemobacteraceae bacterium]
MPKHPTHPDLTRRLARIAGHVEAIRRMLDEERSCPEILQQMKAVLAALENARRILAEDHIRHCLVDAIERKNTKAVIEEIEEVFSQIL